MASVKQINRGRPPGRRDIKENSMGNEQTMEKILAELVAAVEERIQFAARPAHMQSTLEAARRLLERKAEMAAH